MANGEESKERAAEKSILGWESGKAIKRAGTGSGEAIKRAEKTNR